MKGNNIVKWFAVLVATVVAVAISLDSEERNRPTYQDHALNMARQFVRQNLKDKTGAEFDRSSEAYRIRKDGLHETVGSVRSMNGFGARLDNRWSVVMRDNGDESWSLVWLRIGDQKTGEYPEDTPASPSQ